jgi:hypothetical protein
MNGRILLLVVVASLALALFAPAAIAQDDDDGVSAAAGGSLPRTGGPALVEPIAGALLIGDGVAGGVALTRSRNAS